ncbi:MAG: DUF3373 family protein [Campylobacterota bacterium]|nr:DUF3373 family protein [Campylobacterota bacterium]
MKKSLAILLPFLILHADESNSELLKRLQMLENEIKSLKTQIKQNSDDVASFEPILESVETKSILDRVNFSPELELRLDKFDYSLGNIAGENTRIYGGQYNGQLRRDNYTKNFEPAASVRFRLNMSAALTNNVNFIGRMVIEHSSQSNERVCILSRDIKSAESQTAMDIDRAYFDYKSDNKENTLTFGILPTTGGTPTQYAKEDVRRSMFPALVFDIATYGLIGTRKIGEDTYARVIAAKAYTLNANIYPYQCNRENIDNANVLGAFVDTKFTLLGDGLLSFGANFLQDFKAHPYLGPDVSSNDSHVLGDMLTLGVGADINEFLVDDLTIFTHFAISNPYPNGNVDDYQIVNQPAGTTASGNQGFSEASYAKGEMVSSNGYGVYLGTKYDITSDIRFGAEYNYGSKYWFSATQGAEDMYNKLATRGWATESYLIWRFHKYMYTKIGYLYIKEDYTGSGWHFGEPVSKDGKQSIGYATLNAKF